MLYLPRVLAVTFARGDPSATSSRTSGPTVPFSPVPIYGFRPLANLHALLIEAPLKMNICQRFKGLSSIILCWAMIQVLLVKKVHNCKIFRTPPPKTPATYTGSYLFGGVRLIGCRWQTFLYLMGTTYCSFSSRLQPGRALVLQPTPQCGADVLLLKEKFA